MADANFIESCSACRFFLAPDGAIGVCRRYPTHQNRHGNDWCGDFNQKPQMSIGIPYFMKDKIDGVLENIIADRPKRGRKPKVQE